jgi:cytochrome c biogenesis factor
MNNQNQNYANHRRMHPLYHFLLSLLTVVLFVSAVIELVRSFQSGNQVFPAFLFLLISVILIVIFLLVRSYPLKVQDRAIRAEENLRHYVLTQKLLDSRLHLNQIVALRFASDAEFPSLCQKAAAEQLSPDAIKKSIQQWRDDNYRV